MVHQLSDPAMTDPWFLVSGPRAGMRQVEAWSGYPLQFAGQRRFPWAEQMARQLQTALSELALSPAETLAGVYLSTDVSPCDAENRLFVNPAECIPKGVTSLRFERGAGLPPPSPVPGIHGRGARLLLPIPSRRHVGVVGAR
jgi:hypothetical protein